MNLAGTLREHPMTTTLKTHRSRPSRLAAIFLFAASAFLTAALATSWTGPVGDDIAEGLTGLLGAFAWIVPMEIALVSVTHLRGERSRILGALCLGDAAAVLGLVTLFEAGSLGSMIGTDARCDIGGLGTALAVVVIVGVLVIGRLSLLGRTLCPIAIPLGKRAARFAKARFDAWRSKRAPATLVDLPKVIIALPEPQAASLSPKPPHAQPVTKAERPAGAGALRAPKGRFALPTLEFLKPAKADGGKAASSDDGQRLISTLAAHDVAAKVEHTLVGPTVTTFEVSLASGVKVSQVRRLVDDLSLTFGRKIRMVAASAGLVGFEVPNKTRQPVNFRQLLEDDGFQKLDAALPVVLGRDMQGQAVYADLAAMPHGIVAGASGSGKSVGLNVMLASLLCKKTPDELRFIMIDPKVVELAAYDKIPHMLMPVVTDMQEAAAALAWAVGEMERRYQLFAKTGSKNIASYNGKATAGERLAHIVIVVDEFADLIMQQGKEVEASVVRLGQKARAAGMHMILATQRPSVDVITGTIKANFSSRIAYRVAQAVDSRTILDETGAEALLGMGDSLVKLNGASDCRRVQCPMISEDEIAALCDAIRPASPMSPLAPAPKAAKTPKINVVTAHQAQA